MTIEQKIVYIGEVRKTRGVGWGGVEKGK
jgi:hypothetical protein